MQRNRIQWKYFYRFACAVILTVIASGLFLASWYDFVQENNQMGHLLGLGNLSMSVLLYIALYGGIGHWLHAFKIGVERKASVSMIEDAEKDGRPHPAGEHDDRITRVGRIIRACRVDELPQLLNIIRGDMSIVGPRPERVEHVQKYTEDIPEFVFRTKVKAGLTGMAQVYGKYNTTALDKLKFDMIYITNFSILLDLQIIFETLKILFQKESTEGFSEEQAMEVHDGGEERS